MSVPSGRDLPSCFFKGLRSKCAAKIWLILGRSDLIVASMLELKKWRFSWREGLLRYGTPRQLPDSGEIPKHFLEDSFFEGQKRGWLAAWLEPVQRRLPLYP